MIAAFAYLMLASALHREKASLPRMTVSLDGLDPGSLLETIWAGRRLLVLHRTPGMLDALPPDASLSDPLSRSAHQAQAIDRRHRGIHAEYLVVVGYGPASGCPVEFVPPGTSGFIAPWPGGFRDRCSGAWYDAAGRGLAASGATGNLVVPPHRFDSDRQLVIGGEQDP